MAKALQTYRARGSCAQRKMYDVMRIHGNSNGCCNPIGRDQTRPTAVQKTPRCADYSWLLYYAISFQENCTANLLLAEYNLGIYAVEHYSPFHLG